MKVLVAGATGVIGRRLVPQLLAGGHEVTALARSRQSARAAEALGARPVQADALDAEATMSAVGEAAPEVLIHQLTSLPRRIDPRHIERDFVFNDRLRSEGTRHLVAAAQASGTRRVIAQSIAFMYAPGPPGTIHPESDPLLSDEQAPQSFRRSARAVRELESAVLAADGVVLRYGYFYGPGSAIAPDGSAGEDVARRRLPVVGGGGGVWSFVHVDDAASATVAALERGRPGAYNVVDDEPARVSEWLPAFADAVGAPKPWRAPAFLARLAAGSYGVATMTRAQGASNELAKAELGWAPAHPSWREGFRSALR
ncbi:MAG TPA: NAD(P)-dependent oxidoreductase [Solirubrobacteraceae bacterium]|nr:NAD(P)-dependent oxidoreductase [Solirubrobacteraceae bacterium]